MVIDRYESGAYEAREKLPDEVYARAGEEKAVTITIPNAELKFWTPDGWVLDGAYTVYVGTDSRSATAI